MLGICTSMILLALLRVLGGGIDWSDLRQDLRLLMGKHRRLVGVGILGIRSAINYMTVGVRG